MAIKVGGTTVIDDSRNITTSVGTVDGRDVAADGAKLDGIDQGLATTDSPTFDAVTATSFAGDGSSLTGLAAGATGGSTDEIFWENGQNVTTDYTITNGKNAMSAGPITIDSGVTVTVGAGETWTVI
jgi:hypothetical protein